MGKGKKIHDAKKRALNGTKPSAPPKPPPSPLALAIIKSFLLEHNLTSLHKALKRDLRKKVSEGWNMTSVRTPSAQGLTLEKLIEHWQSAQTSAEESDNTSDGGTSSSGTSKPAATSGLSGVEQNISSGNSESTSSSDSDDQTPAASKRTKTKQRKAADASRSSSSSLSSSSESDADDEQDTVTKGKKSTTKIKKVKAAVVPPTIPSDTRSLKRKADTSSSESSSDMSESEDAHRPAKRSKIEAVGRKSITPTSSESSSDSSSSEEEENVTVLTQEKSSSDSSESESSEEESPKIPTAAPAVDRTGSESSGTVLGDKQGSTESSLSSDDHYTVSSVVKKELVAMRKHVGAKPTPLAELSAKVTADTHISNQYVSYEYADKAFQDLSVTRGRGFQKEKNKKKRGSYRGGAIDINGGKAYKFED